MARDWWYRVANEENDRLQALWENGERGGAIGVLYQPWYGPEDGPPPVHLRIIRG